jgi:hypothetical protein
VLLEPEQLRDLALEHAGHGHAGPAAHDLGDVLLVDLLLQHALLGLQLVERLAGLGDPALELGDLAVADLGRPLEVDLALDLAPLGLELLLEGADGGDGLLLAIQCPIIPADCSRRASSSRSSASRRSTDAASVSLASATRSISSWRMRRSTTSTSVGMESISMRSRLAASSTRSMALSGRKRPVR